MQMEWLFWSGSFGRTDMDACVVRPSLLNSSSLNKTGPPHSLQHTTFFKANCIPLTSSIHAPFFGPSLSLSLSELLTTRILTGSMWGEGELSLAGCSQTAFGICCFLSAYLTEFAHFLRVYEEVYTSPDGLIAV
jgi:hypothetical protein